MANNTSGRNNSNICLLVGLLTSTLLIIIIFFTPYQSVANKFSNKENLNQEDIQPVHSDINNGDKIDSEKSKLRFITYCPVISISVLYALYIYLQRNQLTEGINYLAVVWVLCLMPFNFTACCISAAIFIIVYIIVYSARRNARSPSNNGINGKDDSDNAIQLVSLKNKLIGKYLDVSKCIIDLSNIGSSTVGETNSLSVLFFNKNRSEYFFKETDTFSVEVRRKADNRLIPTVLEPSNLIGNCKVNASFTCYNSGRYDIKIYINKLLAEQEPICHFATALNMHALNTRLNLTSKTLVLSKDQPFEVSILPKDQYENEAHLEERSVYLEVWKEVSNGIKVTVPYEFSIRHNFPYAEYKVLFTVLEVGTFNACLTHSGTILGQGVFNLIVLEESENKALESNIKSGKLFMMQAKMTIEEQGYKDRKIYCQLTYRKLVLKEYFFMFIPHRLEVFRVRPTTLLTPGADPTEVIINDGRHDSVHLKFSNPKDSQKFLAAFNIILLMNVGGSINFEEKRQHFYLELTEHMKKKRTGDCAITVSRDNIIQDIITCTKDLNKADWYKKWYVKFTQESGLDFGGITRELFSVLSRELFTPNNGDLSLFTNFEGNVNALSHPNHNINANKYSIHYTLVGKLIAKCLIESANNNNLFLNARFTRSFFAQLLGLRIDAKYFESDDKALYTGKIKYMKEMDNVEELETYFAEEVYDSEGKLIKTVPLKPNSANILVTSENRQEYFDLLAEYTFSRRVKSHMDYITRGLYELIPDSLINLFDESELELLICGVSKYDIEEWKSNCKRCSTSPAFANILSWFWTLAESLPESDRARILHFATGTSQLPPGGFASLEPKFQIGLATSSHGLPSAHTCFNYLILPQHATYEEFKDAFMLAIQEGSEGFGLA